jgi:hypothetical protein
LLSRDYLLDDFIPKPIIHADILIEVATIQWAVAALRDNTAFLDEIAILDEKIPVVEKSINDLIAGPDRTMADIFDFTGKTSLHGSLMLFFNALPSSSYDNLCRLCWHSYQIGPIIWKEPQHTR